MKMKMKMKKKAAIFDIDGTLFDDSHRKHLAEAHQWPEYFAAGADDVPNFNVINELQSQQAAGHEIVLMTGCPEQHRAMTVLKLEKAGIRFEVLLMRPENNYAKNHDLKAGWLAQLAEYEFTAAFDDMTGSISMFKSAGIPAYLVKDGVPAFEHGKAPKAGKGVGRKLGQRKQPESVVISFRLSKALALEHKITNTTAKKIVMSEIAKRTAPAVLCKHNNLAKHGELGICDAEPNGYPLLPGDCPCDDFEPFGA